MGLRGGAPLAWPTRNGRRNDSDESRPNWLEPIPPPTPRGRPRAGPGTQSCRPGEAERAGTEEILRLWAWEE